jgi:hypothetical protein
VGISVAELSALAALAGSALGGIAPLISNHINQRGLTKREILTRELSERQTLYADFITAGATVYVRAVTSNDLDKGDDVIHLYALVGRIRLLGSPPVIQAAEEFARLVTKRFGEQNISLEDLREAALSTHVDPLNDFSVHCRRELQTLIRQRII